MPGRVERTTGLITRAYWIVVIISITIGVVVVVWFSAATTPPTLNRKARPMSHESRVKRIDGTRTAGAKHHSIERRAARQLKWANR